VNVGHGAKLGIAFSFALIHSSPMLIRNKNQGKHDRSARFSRLARGKSQWIDINCLESGRFLLSAHLPLGKVRSLLLSLFPK
jgi:hypothetical protein